MKNLLTLVASAALTLLVAGCASRPPMPPIAGPGPERCTEALPRTAGLCGQP